MTNASPEKCPEIPGWYWVKVDTTAMGTLNQPVYCNGTNWEWTSVPGVIAHRIQLNTLIHGPRIDPLITVMKNASTEPMSELKPELWVHAIAVLRDLKKWAESRGWEAQEPLKWTADALEVKIQAQSQEIQRLREAAQKVVNGAEHHMTEYLNPRQLGTAPVFWEGNTDLKK